MGRLGGSHVICHRNDGRFCLRPCSVEHVLPYLSHWWLGTFKKSIASACNAQAPSLRQRGSANCRHQKVHGSPLNNSGMYQTSVETHVSYSSSKKFPPPMVHNLWCWQCVQGSWVQRLVELGACAD